jgi:thiol-disulfide isomerase/thioredoxin
MKKICLLIAVLAFVSCKTEMKDYVTISGKLNHDNPDITQISNIFIKDRESSKEILVQADGSFSDTLKVADGLHYLSDGADGIFIFLRNGYDLDVSFIGTAISQGAKFEGIGAETNNFLELKRNFFFTKFANPKYYFGLDQAEYDATLAEAKSMIQQYKDLAPNLDSVVNNMELERDEKFFSYIEDNYKKMSEKLLKFKKGNVSPVFNNYENFNGGTTSLSDLKGSYVYIDIWATWCAPCKAQFPFSKELENDYHGKNIKFVGISVDKEGAYDTWKQMVENEELGGIQLIADLNLESDFIKEYDITSIPRYILLDPEGKIVNAEAPRPSEPKLRALFTELGI